MLVVAGDGVARGARGGSARRRPCVLCVLAQVWLAAPRIEEGHNVFLVDGPGGALEAGLPPAVFRFMAAEFDARYPPARRCDPKQPTAAGAARGFPTAAFAFSADGISTARHIRDA